MSDAVIILLVLATVLAVFGWLLFWIVAEAYRDLAAEARDLRANLDTALAPEPTPLFDQLAGEHPGGDPLARWQQANRRHIERAMGDMRPDFEAWEGELR